MLSILIPIYNYNCVRFVSDLHEQAVTAHIPFEIILIEDGSNQFLEENSQIGAWKNCLYEPLKYNIGRSAIRNLLASKAQYPYLLFLDCDSRIVNNDFIAKYVNALQTKTSPSVISGGRVYDKIENIDKNHLLHFTHGIKREPTPANQSKYAFISNNFIIEKELFNRIKFNENIVKYGHEDTLFGEELKKFAIEINYINNPILHEGLDNNNAFLQKTEESIQSLLELKKMGVATPQMCKRINLIQSYEKAQKYKMTKFISGGFKITKSLLRKNLMGKYPSMFLFDCYRLGYISTLNSKN